MNKRMLILNMGSTSTKISVYDGYEKIWVDEDTKTIIATDVNDDQPIVMFSIK